MSAGTNDLDERVLRTITDLCDADGKPCSVEAIANASGIHVESVRVVLERLESNPSRVMRMGSSDEWLPCAPTTWEREICQKLFGTPEAREMWERLGEFFAARLRR